MEILPLPHRVCIIGGGVAGLVAARLLHRSGIDFALLEARERLGGRVLSAGPDEQPSADGFDLGPSWFWPEMQPELAGLVEALGLDVFPQYAEGDVLFHRMARERPQRYAGFGRTATSMRIVGGAARITDALAVALPADRLHLESSVTALSLHEAGIEVAFREKTVLRSETFDQVILAAPPRLLARSVSFSPELPQATLDRWRATPTWMAPHAKFYALYDRPFWREAGLSGAAQSMVGPLSEIHDATTASGQAALFGFIGAGAAQREGLGRNALIARAVEQLGLLFGPQALAPTSVLLKDWARDPLTATEIDQAPSDHLAPCAGPWLPPAWASRVHMAGSETSRTEPGYLAGAVAAARSAVSRIKPTSPDLARTEQP